MRVFKAILRGGVIIAINFLKGFKMKFADDKDKLTLIDELENYKDINFQIQFLLSSVLEDYNRNLQADTYSYSFQLEGIITLLQAQNLVIDGFERYIKTGDVNQWHNLEI